MRKNISERIATGVKIIMLSRIEVPVPPIKNSRMRRSLGANAPRVPNTVATIGSASYQTVKVYAPIAPILMIKIYLSQISAVLITGVSFFIIGPISGLLLVFRTAFFNQIIINETNQINFMYITLLGVIGTGFAVWLFNLLIKETSSVFASSVTYLIPIVAIIWGIIDGEGFSFLKEFSALLFLRSLFNKTSPQKLNFLF